MRIALSIIAILLLSSCNKSKPSNAEASEYLKNMRQRMAEQENLGRYQFHPASGEMPALVFDTSTGCVEMIEKFMLDSNKRMVWMRSVSDNVTDGAKKRCPASVPEAK